MTELAARTLQDDAQVDRPAVVRAVVLVLIAGWIGALLALLALAAPGLLGVATLSFSAHGPDWFAPQTPGAVLADVAVIGVFVWTSTLCARGILGWAQIATPPAWTPTALTFGGAGLLVAGFGLSFAAGCALAAIALRWTAYRIDGSVRPEPLAGLSRPWRRAARFGLPVLALGVATAYAIYHPLTGRWWDDGLAPALRPSRADLHQLNPILENRGGRPIRVVAIEPGEEHGYALHLAGVAFRDAPFRSFTLGPHATRNDLEMTISRAGCRPGTSGRIDSVRVRYDLGGARSTLLKLSTPLTLAC
jgi:hypothetical protein